MNAEENGELPEGWAQATLADIGLYLNGRAFKTSEWATTGRPIIRIQDLTGTRSNPNYFQGDVEERYVVQPGAFLISWAATLDAFIWDGPEGVLNQHIFKVYSKIDTRFHFYLVKQALAGLYDRTHGSGMVHVTKDKFDTLPIPLPPLAEQLRIVAAVEAVLARVNAARERLNRVPAILKRFRQAVLSAACSGRLTADWRNAETNDELPTNWERTPLGTLILEKPQNGVYKPQDEYGTGVLILRIDNFYEGVIEPWATLKRVKLTAPEIEQYGLANGDVVVNRVNSFKFLGKCALVRDLPESCVFESNMMRLRLNGAKVRSEFVTAFLCSPEGRDQIRANAKHAVNQSSINQTDVQAVELALPPLAEQQEIVRRVGELFALADVIEERLTDARRMADQLTQAVLAKAFRGELVPTEAELARREGRSYESAADLLSRIRAEREQPAPKPARTRKPKADPA
jgi:type I restriction enzyme S subunit